MSVVDDDGKLYPHKNRALSWAKKPFTKLDGIEKKAGSKL